jgi:hypothetical protein
MAFLPGHAIVALLHGSGFISRGIYWSPAIPLGCSTLLKLIFIVDGLSNRFPYNNASKHNGKRLSLREKTEKNQAAARTQRLHPPVSLGIAALSTHLIGV